MNMVIFMIDLKGKKFIRNVELLTRAKYRDKHQRLRAPLWPRVFSPRACSASTVRQGFGGLLACIRTWSCFLHQTLQTHATRAGSTPSKAMSNHRSKTPSFWDRPMPGLHPPAAPKGFPELGATDTPAFRTGPTTIAAVGRFPSRLLPRHLQPSSLPHRTSPSAGSSPEGATCLTLAGAAGRHGWNTTGELGGGASRVETPLHVQWL